MGLPTLFIVAASLMQLRSIWMHGTEGHSMGGWLCLFAGLGLITERCKQRRDDPAFWSFFLQTVIVGLISISILYLRYARC